MKKPNFLSRAGLLLVLLWGLSFSLPLSAGEEISEYGNTFQWVTVGLVAVKAEVVKSPAKLYLGLGNRKELPEGRGMLFFMPQVQVQNFCMRAMQFPIDIIWIVGGNVAGLEKNISPQFPGTLCSPQPVNYVLEVPGGFSDRYGINVGDPVSW